MEETLFLIGPPGLGLSLDRSVEFAQLANHRLLLPSRGHGVRTLVDRYAEEVCIPLSVKVEADSYSTLKSLVRNGHGVTILPLAPIHEDLRTKRLEAAPLVNPVPVRRLIMSFPSDRPTPRLARFAGNAITTTVATLVEKGIWSGRILQEQEASAGNSDS